MSREAHEPHINDVRAPARCARPSWLGASRRDGLTGARVRQLTAFTLAVGLVVGLFIFRRHRKAEIAALPAATGWVPEVDPSQTTRVMKVCGFCGKVNVPLRTTCEACGKPLRRFGFR